jgi:ribosomal protein S12 methylthiotransferase accessory factor
MDIEISFPGGKRVAARVGDHLIETDQPEQLGGAGSAPAPFDLFLAALGTCAGIYVLGFLQSRGLPTQGLRVRQQVEMDSETHLASRVCLEISLPPGVPERYRPAILRAAQSCKVKKTLAQPPLFEVGFGAE